MDQGTEVVGPLNSGAMGFSPFGPLANPTL